MDKGPLLSTTSLSMAVVVHGEGFKEMKRLGDDQDLARFVDAPCTNWSETTETLLPSNHSRATAQIKS